MSGSRFIVDLGDVKLPPLVEKQVAAEIQGVVIRALAQSNAESQGGAQERIGARLWDEFPGKTEGLWPGYPNPDYLQDFYDSVFGSGGSVPITIQDHTTIMKAIMENPLQVIRKLPDQYKSKTARRPSGTEVLQAALQVEEIDNLAKARIRAVLDLLPQIEEGQAELPQSTKKALEGLRQKLANKSLDEKRRVFRDPGLRKSHRDDGLAEAMEVAAQILEDGQDSIYAPDHSFYRLLRHGQGSSSARGSLSDLADVDGVGATAGGAVGAVAGGVGAGPGAVAGGAGASAGYGIAWAIDAIWDLF